MARFHISTYILLAQTLVIGIIAVFIFLFGIPPSIKKWLQEEALEYMGENKASYMMKAGVDMLPEADQDEIKGIRSGAKDAMGKAAKNPLGDAGGNALDDLTKGFR